MKARRSWGGCISHLRLIRSESKGLILLLNEPEVIRAEIAEINLAWVCADGGAQ